MNQTVMSFKSFAKEDDFFDLPIQQEESKDSQKHGENV